MGDPLDPVTRNCCPRISMPSAVAAETIPSVHTIPVKGCQTAANGGGTRNPCTGSPTCASLAGRGAETLCESRRTPTRTMSKARDEAITLSTGQANHLHPPPLPLRPTSLLRPPRRGAGRSGMWRGPEGRSCAESLRPVAGSLPFAIKGDLVNVMNRVGTTRFSTGTSAEQKCHRRQTMHDFRFHLTFVLRCRIA